VDPVDNSCDCTITLVHGTVLWLGSYLVGGLPYWIGSRSALRKRLGDTLHPIFVSFVWGGRNSHKARLAAARTLSDSLKETLSKHPLKRHFIIAHSHGGNVALYALKYLTETEQKQLSGIITLGTPFIRSIQSDVRTLREDLLYCLLGGTLVWSLLFVILMVYAIWTWSIDWVQAAVMGIIILLGCACLVIVGAHSLEDWEKASEQMDELLDARVPPGVQVCCLVANADEAGLWLRVWGWFDRRFFNTSYLSVVQQFTEVAKPIIRAGFHPVVRMTALGLLIGTYFFSLVLVLTILIGKALTASSPWGYGQSTLQAWVVNVATSVRPSTQYQRKAWITKSSLIMSLGLDTVYDDYDLYSFAPQKFCFRHSWLHEDENVIDKMADWIQHRCRVNLSPSGRLQSNGKACNQERDTSALHDDSC
jgi:hypothetical protein